MNALNTIILVLSIIVIAYGMLAIFVALYSLKKNRDESYRQKYEDFQSQKKRIRNRLNKRDHE